MDNEIKTKAKRLIRDTRVMTLAVSDKDIPWSSPVYFVFHNQMFYFFSNENSRHIQWAINQQVVSASIFHDSDKIDQIFGFQMSGRLEQVSQKVLHLTIVKAYVSKFNFLKKTFGPQIIDNRHFFLEKFKSKLYCFLPNKIFLSDNSKTSGKRSEIDIKQCC
ncbi:MAG: hypothetical protein GY729_06675 [Desulfobacteraceae bacterium]|nr:hypothetical protein [Desulfobacteraceae bacterium]